MTIPAPDILWHLSKAWFQDLQIQNSKFSDPGHFEAEITDFAKNLIKELTPSRNLALGVWARAQLLNAKLFRERHFFVNAKLFSRTPHFSVDAYFCVNAKLFRERR